MLADIIDVLADPVDGTALSGADDFSRLVSESGHSYDVARQGYVTLTGGAGLKFSGDDADMVAARETFLSRGHFGPFVEAVSAGIHNALDDAEITDDTDPVICEIGAGTGYYLSHALDDVAGARGVGIDISVHAARHLAKCHSRASAIVADAWSRLPIRDESIDVFTTVFAPRNAEEFARALTPGGEVVVLSAAPGHLSELRAPLGILDVEAGKIERMIRQAEGYLVPVGDPEIVEFEMYLDQDSIATQIGMSPSARHLDAGELAHRVAELPDKMTVTARATITRLKKS